MALMGDKARERRSGDNIAVTVAAGEEVFNGSMVVLIGGLGYKGKAGSGSLVGIAKEHIVGDGERKISCERGIYKFAVQGAALSVCAPAYVYDDDTVTAADSGNILAGAVFDVDEDGGAWIDIR